MADDLKVKATVELDDQLSKPVKDMLKAVETMDRTVKTLASQFDGLVKALTKVSHEFQGLSHPLHSAQQGTSALGTSMHGLRDNLKSVENRLKASETSYRKAEQRITGLERQINQLNTVVRRLSDANAQSQRRIADLTNQMAALHAHQQQVAQSAQQAADAEKLFAERLEAVKSVGESLQIAGAALMAPVASSIAAGTMAVQKYAGVESSTAGLINTFSAKGDSTKQLREAVALAERLGVSLPGSTEDMLRMFTALRQQGVPMQKIMNGIAEATANFATLFGQSFDAAAVMMPKFSEALGVADDKSTELVDTLQRLQGASGLTVDDLYNTFKYAGSSLKTMGIQGTQSAKGLSAVLALMANSGIEGSTAGTSLTASLGRMAGFNAATVAKTIAKITNGKYAFNLHLFDNKGQFIGLQNMMRELQKLRVLTDQQQMVVLNKLFGEQGARPMSALVKAGIAGFTEMNYRMDSQLSTQKKIDTIMGTITMKAESLGGTFDTFVSKLGEHIAKLISIQGILDKLNDLLADINEWIDKNPKLVDDILKKAALLAGILAGIGATLTAVGTAMVGIATAMATWHALAGHITVMGGAWHAVLTRIGGGFTRIISSLGSLMRFAVSPLTYIGRVFSNVFAGLGAIAGAQLSSWSAAILTGVRSLSSSILAWLIRWPAFSYLLGNLQNVGGWLARSSGLIRLIGVALGRLGILRFIAPLLRLNWVGIALTVIFELIRRHWNEIQSFFSGFGSGFMALWDEIIEAGKIAMDAFAPLVPTLSAAFDNIMMVVNQLLDALLGTTSASASKDSFANGFALGEVFAKVLKLVLKIVETVGYLAKAITDTFADIGRNLGKTWAWIEDKYQRMKAMVGLGVNNNNVMGPQGAGRYDGLNQDAWLEERQRQNAAIVARTRQVNNTTNNITVNMSGNAANRQAQVNQANGIAKEYAALAAHQARVAYT